MPRTKIPKNAKRNREVTSREEKIRTYESKMDSIITNLDEMGEKYVTAVDHQLELIGMRLQTELRDMKMSDFMDVLSELAHFSDYKASVQTQIILSHSVCNTSMVGCAINSVVGSSNRNDEGYLTEDSSLGATSSSSTLAAHTGTMIRSAMAMRTPGPLHSARARRARRSRSACSELNILPSAKPHTAVANSSSTTGRGSRSKMRTPMAARPKAFSADRTPLMMNKTRKSSPSTPPMAFLRWPKPGEIALSKFGSPIVAQVMPDKFANVNIPIKNGVLSLRPKKLAEVKADLLESLDSDTLHQIKTLHENLQLIVNTANKAGIK